MKQRLIDAPDRPAVHRPLAGLQARCLRLGVLVLGVLVLGLPVLGLPVLSATAHAAEPSPAAKPPAANKPSEAPASSKAPSSKAASAKSASSRAAAGATLPQRDLTVEFRQIEEGRESGAHYSAGSADATVWEPQMVQVRNGEKALLRLNDAIPMQWTQSVSTQALSTGGSTQSSSSAVSVNNALTWFDAGQSLSVQPQWPGGNKPARLELEVQRASVEPRMGADLPRQSRASVSTTITAPLAEWITIASTGKAPKEGVYSSEAGLQVRRLLQVRVMAP